MDISRLRTQSSLDIHPDELNQISIQAAQLVSEYFAGIRERPVRASNHAGKTLSLIDNQLNRQGVPLEALIEECQSMLELSRHNGHPRFFGYVASPSTPIGSYADLIASALNANITCWRSGPAGTEVERLVVKWLGQLISYDDDARGLLTSGGSMANMIALSIAARRTLGPDVRNKGLWQAGSPLGIYASTEVHLSIAKAADILGFGRDCIRTVDCDERHRINPTKLRRLIEEDLNNGIRPSCVVASAGTVNTGVVDPLDQVAGIASEFNLWFHVDGAYGAPGVLDPRKKHLFNGLALADSVSLDPHKWLYVPVDAGCLLFRDPLAASGPFRAEAADYIKLHGHTDDEAYAFWDYGVELSRRFRALKVWFTLRYYGTNRIAESIAQDNLLAEYLGDLVSRADDFELLAPVDLSICCFRYIPRSIADKLGSVPGEERETLNKDLNEFNEKLMSLVQTSGQAYLSNAIVNGLFGLRACITNFRTIKSDIEETVQVVRELAHDLLKRDFSRLFGGE